MPVPNHKTYMKVLKSAKENAYALPSINVASLSAANAALEGFAEAKSDGIIQVSTGAAEFISGQSVKSMFLGAVSLAQHVHLLAEQHSVYVALHTDHCVEGKLDFFVRPLIEETSRRRKQGLPNLYNGHMFDGSALPLERNLEISKSLLKLCSENELVLEVEIGVVGGEEDDVKAEKGALLYTNSEDMVATAKAIGLGEHGAYMLAATFGNVHGVYNPGVVQLKPSILKEGQQAVQETFGAEKNPFYLVFHGGSGSALPDIHETLDYGVIKMNVDTDTQYAFSRPIADHMFRSYDGVLKVDGGVGDKKKYDPRVYLKMAEVGMKERVVRACEELRSAGKTLFA